MASGNEDGRQAKGGGRGKGCFGVLAALLLLVVVLSFVGGIYVSGVEEDIDKRLQVIADAGEPASLADIPAWIGPVADEDNAAILLQQAMDAHQEPSGPDVPIPYVNKVEEPKPTEPLPEDMKAAIADYLQQNQDSLAAVSEAAKRPDCLFSLNYAAGAAMDLPHLAELRGLERVMCIKTIYEAEMGKPDETLQTLVAAARLSEATRRDPLLTSQFVRIAMHSMVADSIEQSLNRTTFTSEQLKQLQDEIKKINMGDCIYRGLLGERCMMMDQYGGIGSSGAMPAPGVMGMRWGPIVWRNRIDQRYALRTLSDMIEAAKLPPAEAMKRVDSMCDEALPENRGKVQRLFTLLSDILLPALGRSVEAQARDTSILNCAATGLALLRYHQDKGAFPQSLGELVPQYLDQMPIDCMDGQVIRYLHDDGGFTVYSVGPNKKDDGGRPPDKESSILKSGDMTFTVRLRSGN